MALADGLVVFVQILVYIWSFLTWPFYFIYYDPWRKVRSFNRKRANRIDIKTDEVTYRGT